MKKHIGVQISIIAAAILLTAASKPSLDGRALVASPGELPPGLYVKAAAFLPGDTVLITNPAAKVSIEALVFGTFSTSEGVAVVLSPEAADVLLITKDSNSIVQLTKSGSDTERSVLARAFDKASPDLPPQEPADDSVPYEDYVKSEVPAQKEPVPAEVQDMQAAETLEPMRTLSETAPETVEAEPVSEPLAVPAPLFAPESEPVPEQQSVPVSESLIAETAPVSEPEAPAAAEDEVRFVPDSEDMLAEEVPAETIPQKEEETVFTPFADSTAESESEPEPESDIAEETPPVESAAEIAAEPEMPEAREELPDLVLPEASALPEESPQDIAVSESVYDEPLVEAALASLETEPFGENAANVTEPNILIAADDNPPVFEKASEEENELSPSAKDTVLPDYFTAYQEDDSEFTEKRLYTETADFDTESFLIDSLASFGNGSYCIQLATYKNKAHIADVLEKYGNKYPVRLLKSEKTPGGYQVLIGPLNKDEYPVILKRFVARGFKDAFVRTVQ